MGTTAKLINYEDSLTMPENKLEEIVHGESRFLPPPNKKHGYLLTKLSKVLDRQLDGGAYEVLSQCTGLGIERAPLTYRIPDLMVFRTEDLRRDRVPTAANDPYIWTVPELIVECLSSSNRKGSIQELLADYARIAAPEVWLLDPQARQAAAYRYESGELKPSQTIDSGQATPLRLPKVTVGLAELWAVFEGLA